MLFHFTAFIEVKIIYQPRADVLGKGGTNQHAAKS